MTHEPAIPVGTKVRLPSTGEVGIVIHTWPDAEMQCADCYVASKELRAQGHPARLEQGDDHWYVRIRQQGHPQLNFDGGSYEEAQSSAARIEAERRTGPFIDYTHGHRVRLAELIERYVDEMCPGGR